jgi:hypothetical protein
MRIILAYYELQNGYIEVTQEHDRMGHEGELIPMGLKEWEGRFTTTDNFKINNSFDIADIFPGFQGRAYIVEIRRNNEYAFVGNGPLYHD